MAGVDGMIFRIQSFETVEIKQDLAPYTDSGVIFSGGYRFCVSLW